MPLETQVERNGQPVPIRWGYFALSCMYTAAVAEQLPDQETDAGNRFGDLDPADAEDPVQPVDFSLTPIYYLDVDCDLVRKGSQKLTRLHRFVDPTDGEVLELQAGDVLSAWREHE